jgi:tetratricopeptide (TPR) repeat protein
MKRLLFILTLFYFSNLFAGKVNINSSPQDCEVSVINPMNGAKTLLGKTPYDTDMDQLKANIGDNGVIQLDIHKPGFQRYHMALPVVGSSDVKVFANLEVENDIKLTQDIDLLMADLFDVLRMVRVQDFSNGMKKLELLEQKFPHYSIIYEMKGMISYLRKNFKEALNFYRKSFGLNPKNREAYRMKVYLEKKFNVNTVQGSEG